MVRGNWFPFKHRKSIYNKSFEAKLDSKAKISVGSYLRRPDLANAELFSFGSYLLDVTEGIFPLFRRGFEYWTLGWWNKIVLEVTKTRSSHCCDGKVTVYSFKKDHQIIKVTVSLILKGHCIKMCVFKSTLRRTCECSVIAETGWTDLSRLIMKHRPVGPKITYFLFARKA